MKTKTIKTTTAPAIAGGNPEIKAAKAYINFQRLESANSKSEFGEKLNSLLRKYTSRKEEDIRQDAAESLFKSYLLGNLRLKEAVKSGKTATVAKQIARSTQAAINIARMRSAREKAIRTQGLEKYASLAIHDQPHAEEAELRSTIIRLIQAAEEGKKIKARDAKLLLRLIRDETSRREVAEENGISEAAVSLRIKRLLPQLQRLAHEVEI